MGKDNFDFGFSAVHEDELEKIQETKQNLDDNKAKLTKLHSMISVLLDNLEKDADKPYLYWPNRIERIKEFRKKVDSIVE